jgi:hypothetical protein
MTITSEQLGPSELGQFRHVDRNGRRLPESKHCDLCIDFDLVCSF